MCKFDRPFDQPNRQPLQNRTEKGDLIGWESGKVKKKQKKTREYEERVTLLCRSISVHSQCEQKIIHSGISALYIFRTEKHNNGNRVNIGWQESTFHIVILFVCVCVYAKRNFRIQNERNEPFLFHVLFQNENLYGIFYTHKDTHL